MFRSSSRFSLLQINNNKSKAGFFNAAASSSSSSSSQNQQQTNHNNNNSRKSSTVSAVLPQQQKQKSKDQQSPITSNSRTKHNSNSDAERQNQQTESLTTNRQSGAKILENISCRLSKSLQLMDETDFKIAATLGEMTQSVAFNETLSSSMTDLLHGYIIAATTKTDSNSNKENVGNEFDAAVVEGKNDDDVEDDDDDYDDDAKLDHFALEKSLAILQQDFEARRMRASALQSLQFSLNWVENQNIVFAEKEPAVQLHSLSVWDVVAAEVGQKK